MKIFSASGSYQVTFCENLGRLSRKILWAAPTHLLVDAKISKEYRTLIRRWSPREKTLSIPASETEKSLHLIPQRMEALLRMNVRKNSLLLVVGGGVLQDIGCFIASVLFRGLNWIFVPTTLLAQADSCLGGKSSINLGRHKNQVGTFYPPREIFVCQDFLRTLPDDQYRSGMGEIIKLMWIRNPAGIFRVMNPLSSLLSRRSSPAQTLSLIKRSLKTKKEFIEKDEFDFGPRKILNFGHTFGHAFESVSSYAIPHGVAVTLGMVAAAFFSEHLFQGPRGLFDRTWNLCFPWFHPYQRKLLRSSPHKIIQTMLKDKKNRDNRIQLILPDAKGKPRLVKPCDKALIYRGLNGFLRKIKSPIHIGMSSP